MGKSRLVALMICIPIDAIYHIHGHGTTHIEYYITTNLPTFVGKHSVRVAVAGRETDACNQGCSAGVRRVRTCPICGYQTGGLIDIDNTLAFDYEGAGRNFGKK